MPPPFSSVWDYPRQPNRKMDSPNERQPEGIELQLQNSTLAQEVEFWKQQSASLRQELQSFVYAAGHDLKESLRSISSYTQLLTRTVPEDESIQVYAGFILDGVKSATTLIDTLVMLSRAGSSPSRSSVNLASCVHTALYKLSGEVSRTSAKITFQDLPQVSVNQADFDQVFERLIDNAIRYAGANTPVIQITGEEGSDGHLISLRDNGPGIEPKFHEEAFRPFKRLHGREISGAGVGLAVCRKIVEAHGGRFWVESDGTAGSTFKFSLPY